MSDTRESEAHIPPSLHDYAARVIAQRLHRMLSHTEGVRASEETEPVHQMRVWSRRTRAALEIFEGLFDDHDFARLEDEVKRVTGALGAARDLDVMIETLRERDASLPEEQRGGLESFIARQGRKREGIQKAVSKAMARLDKQELAQRFERLVEPAAQGSIDEPDAAPPAVQEGENG